MYLQYFGGKYTFLKPISGGIYGGRPQSVNQVYLQYFGGKYTFLKPISGSISGGKL